MKKWLKVPQKKMPDYLEQREGRHGLIFRINYRRDGLNVREVIRLEDVIGDNRALWVRAAEIAERKIADIKYGKAKKVAGAVRSQDLIDQLNTEAKGQDAATIAEKDLTFRHIGAWLKEHYPFASDLTVEAWPKYKAYRRGLNPTVALENHVKRFRMIVNRAFHLGLIPQKITIKFDVKKEEFREEGMIIPRDHEALILAAASRVWRNRSIIQRDTGLRPGECRKLRKGTDSAGNPPNLFPEGDARVLIKIYPQDCKEDRFRDFWVSSARAVGAIREQLGLYPDSPFLFPMETDHGRPMDKHLGGWNVTLRRAFDPEKKGLPVPGYTPHDWRHSYATEMFPLVGIQGSVALCFQLGMSLETADRVYLHLKAADTMSLAETVAKSRSDNA